MADIGTTPAVNYIDPNRIFDIGTVFEGHGKMPNYEDYCICLNLEVEQSSRTFQAAETSENRVMLLSWVSNENKSNVSFMSGTKVMEHTPNVQTTKGFEMTYQDVQDYGITEMLGIKSVNIEYEKYCVPQITVVFTDVRGFSLMAPNELERETNGKMNSKNVVPNFFKAFFMMPPAKFTFTIKGFYGKPVTYETTCVDFRASFNSDTGNFDATVKFVGYQFSFLTDVSVNALIAAPYSDYIGKEYWEAQKANGRFAIPSKNGNMVEMPTLSELKQNFEEIIAFNATNSSGDSGSYDYDYSAGSSEDTENTSEKKNEGKKWNERLKINYDKLKYINDYAAQVNSERINRYSDKEWENNWRKKYDSFSDDEKRELYDVFTADMKHEEGKTWKQDNYKLFTNAIEKVYIQHKFDIFRRKSTKFVEESKQPQKKTSLTKLFEGVQDANKKASDKNDGLKYFDEPQSYESIYMINPDNRRKAPTREGSEEKTDTSATTVDSNAQTVIDTSKVGEHDKDDIKTAAALLKQEYNDWYNLLFNILNSKFKFAFKQEDADAGVHDRILVLALEKDNDTMAQDYLEAISKEASFATQHAEIIPAIRDFNKEYKQDISVPSSDFGGYVKKKLLKPLKKDNKEGKIMFDGFVEDSGFSDDCLNWLKSDVFDDDTFLEDIYNDNGSNQYLWCYEIAHDMRPLNDILGVKTDDPQMSQKEAEKIANEELINKLVWYPSIENFTKILMAHVETLMRMMYNAIDVIHSSQRNPADFGVTVGKDGMCSDVKDGSAYLPPFPRFTEEKTEDGIKKHQDAWIGDWPSNGQVFEEVNLINGIIGGAGEVNKLEAITRETISEASKNIVSTEAIKTSVMNPLSPFDFMTARDPYGDGISSVTDFIWAVSMRMFLTMSMSSFRGVDQKWQANAKRIGQIEADSFFDSHRLSKELLTQLKQMSVNAEKVISIITNGSGNDEYKVNGHWPWVRGSEEALFSTEGDKLVYKLYSFNKGNVSNVFCPTVMTDGQHEINDFMKMAISNNVDMSHYSNIAGTSAEYWGSNMTVDKLLKFGLSGKTSYYNFFKINAADWDKKVSATESAAGLLAGVVGTVSNSPNITLGNGAVSYIRLNENNELSLCEENKPLNLNKKGDDRVWGLVASLFRYNYYNWDMVLAYLKENRICRISKLLYYQVASILMFFAYRKEYTSIFTVIPNNLTNFDQDEWYGFYQSLPKLAVVEIIRDIRALWKASKYQDNYNNPNSVGNSLIANSPEEYVCGVPLYYEKINGVRAINDKISRDVAKNYFEGFLIQLSERLAGGDTANAYSVGTPTVSQNIDNAKQLNEDMKIALYIYLKQLYDKWLPLSTWDSWKFEKFFDGNSDKETQDPHGHTFYFIDSYYTKVGQAILLNPQVINDKLDAAMYQNDYKAMLLPFMSDIYAGHKCMFMSVQNFRDMTKPGAMDDMFQPVSFSEIHMPQKHPDFLVIYPYAPSTIASLNSGKYEADGFMLSDPDDYPRPLRYRSETPGNTWFTIPAFGVQYGQQYQHMFKRISVNMNNPITTEQTLKAKFSIGNMYGKASDRKAITAAQDLYDVFSTYSYTCEITMMGCAWIQPLMYLVLLNIPMFKGSYLIYKVSHTMEPGNMETKITANKMCSVSTPLVSDIFTDVLGGGSGDDYLTRKRNELAATTNDCPYKVYPLWENTANGGGSVDIKISAGDMNNAKAFIRYFTTTPFEGNNNQPYTFVQACAIAGSITQESHFNKNAVGIDSDGYVVGGIAQWNEKFGAGTAMLANKWKEYGFIKKYTRITSKAEMKRRLEDTSNEFQMDFIGNSLPSGFKAHNGSMSSWKSQTNVRDSAWYYAKYYEAPATVEKARLDNAEKYYNEFKDELGRSATRAASTPTKTKIGFCGDSWMRGYENAGLGNMVSDKFDSVFHHKDGANSSKVTEFVKQAVKEECKVIVINCGLNDCLTPGNVVKIASSVDTKSIKLFFCTIPLNLNATDSACKDKLNNNSIIKKFNDVLRNSASKNGYGIIDLTRVNGVKYSNFHPTDYTPLAKFIASNVTGSGTQYASTTDTAANGGTGHGDVKSAFFNAVNKSFNFSTGSNLSRKDNGDKMVITSDAKDRLGLAFDIMLNGYYKYVRSLYWIYDEGGVGNQPVAIEVEVSESEGENNTKRRVGANPSGKTVGDIPKDIHDDFYRSLVKQYGSDSDGNLGKYASKEVIQTYDKGKVKEISITSCDELMAPYMNTGGVYDPLVCGKYTGGTRQRKAPYMGGVSNKTLKEILNYSHTATTWSHGGKRGNFAGGSTKLCASGVEAIFAQGGVAISSYWGGGNNGYPHCGQNAWQDTFFEHDRSWQLVWSGSFADYLDGKFRAYLRPGDAVAMFYTGGGGGNCGGHACMWNGSEWVSDYRQPNGIKGAIPSESSKKADRCGSRSFNIYRYMPFWQQMVAGD